MIRELKKLFCTKKGILVVLAMITVAISAYLNIITVKSVELWPGFAVSLGTLAVSFIPMITSELMSEVYGWKKGFIISSIAYTICLVFVIILDLTTRLGFSGDIYNIFAMEDVGQVYGFIDVNGFTAAYNTLFRGSWVILISSAVAYYLGIFFNCYIMGLLKKKAEESGKDNKFKLFGRFAVSTIVGQTLDNGVFFLIPMIVVLIAPSLKNGALAPWTWTYVWQQVLAAFVIEIAYEIIFFPLTGFLTKKVQKLPESLEEVK